MPFCTKMLCSWTLLLIAYALSLSSTHAALKIEAATASTTNMEIHSAHHHAAFRHRRRMIGEDAADEEEEEAPPEEEEPPAEEEEEAPQEEEVSPQEEESTTPSKTAPYPKRYFLWPPEKIKETLYEWVSYYPDFCRLTTAQEAYGLQTAGGENDCPHDDDVVGCKNYILTLQDYVKHPEGSDSSNRLPEVFLSGELHGNERVGPTAVMEAALLLLQAADCEAKPSRHQDTSSTAQHSFNEKHSDWQSQLKAGKDCRLILERDHGITAVQRKWLARLLSTRRIVIVPTANALGYYQDRREEHGNDPNRDFPYDVEDPKECMKTIAGRTLNEVFREHMFQLSLTFHGGMEVVGYEWGAPTYLNHLSPDDTAQAVIGEAYSQYGGGFPTSDNYKFGTMNDMVYYVRGGFEDWAYAGSWDPDRVIPCEPETYDDYPKEKTIYNDSTLRVFNMLIETSRSKHPQDTTLGTNKDVLKSDTDGNGHVSRNIRLSLLACDAVQPYVSMVGVNDVSLTDDVVPLVALQEDRSSCQDTKAVMVPGNQQNVNLRWTVGGAFEIDSTQLWYAKWDSVPADVLNCVSELTQETLETYFKSADMVSPESGTGFLAKPGPAPRDESFAKEALGPIFEATLDVSQDYKTHDKLIVIAMARVDQSWTKQPKDFAPKLPPQSHVVNARTNPDWHHESAGKVIQGRLDWYSMPLTIVVGDYKDSVGNQAGRPVGTVELSNRFGETTGEYHAGITPSSSSSNNNHDSNKDGDDTDSGRRDNMKEKANGKSSGGYTLQYLGIFTLVGCMFLFYKRWSKSSRRQTTSSDFEQTYQDDDANDDDEFGISSNGGSYSDKPEVELKGYSA